EAAYEGLPLNLLFCGELIIEQRQYGQGCASLCERCSNGFPERQQFKVKLSRKQPDIVEILHSAVQGAQCDHGLEFLCYRRFSRVTEQPGGWHIQQYRVVHQYRRGRYHIAKTDIQLQPY